VQTHLASWTDRHCCHSSQWRWVWRISIHVCV